MNASRQSTAPAAPPSSGENTAPAVCTARNVPTSRPTRPGAAPIASAASSSGDRNAFTAPCSARPTRKTPMSGAITVRIDTTAYAT